MEITLICTKCEAERKAEKAHINSFGYLELWLDCGHKRFFKLQEVKEGDYKSMVSLKEV